MPIRLNLDLVSHAAPKIEAALSGNNVNKQDYYPAAMFYYDHNLDLQKAKTWIEAATKGNETYYNIYLKAEILAKLGDKEARLPPPGVLEWPAKSGRQWVYKIERRPDFEPRALTEKM